VELAKTVEDVGRRFIPITGEFPLNRANLAAVAAILAEHPDAIPELEKAAWELSQDPVAGEHLVEVLEKQGRTARAARVCMMALSAYGDDSVRAKLTHAMDRLQKNLPQRRTDGAVELSYTRTLPIAYRPKLCRKVGNCPSRGCV
jgi:hypothetical protein